MKMCSVLIIDDHPAMRHGLARLILAEPGMQVFAEAGNRMEVLESIKGGPPDMVIMDLELGQESPSGLDLMMELKKWLGDTPVLVFTMHDEDFFRKRAFAAGARGFVSKKGSVAELLATIHAVREGRSCGILSQENEGSSKLRELSPREFEVFKLVGQVLSTKAIAGILNIDRKTVESHKYNIRLKMNLVTMEDLRLYAVQWLRSESK